jgi:hypothetical protein
MIQPNRSRMVTRRGGHLLKMDGRLRRYRGETTLAELCGSTSADARQPKLTVANIANAIRTINTFFIATLLINEARERAGIAPAQEKRTID